MSIKFTAALAGIVALGMLPSSAAMKQMEIKGNLSMYGYNVSYNDGRDVLTGRGPGSEAVAQLDADLDFKMKFSQDVIARLDLEVDNATAGDGMYTSHVLRTGTAGLYSGNRFDIGVDQAYFKISDFRYQKLNLSIGKQNFNFSLRDNGAYSWSYGDPIAVLLSYAPKDVNFNLYWAKLMEDNGLTTTASNDNDQDLVGGYLEYWINEDSLVIGYLNYKSLNTTKTNILHYGIGIDYFAGESLELYGEVAGQSISDDPDALSATVQEGSPMQLTLGVQYAFSGFDWKPTLNVEYYLQGGSDNTDIGWQQIIAGKQSGDNHSLFVESANNRDLNFNAALPGTAGGYSALRLNGWISPKKDITLGLGFHMFKDEDNNLAGKDDMGLEIDLNGKWKYTQDVTFQAGAFMWTNGETDGARNTPATGASEFEDVIGFTVGSALTF